MTCAFWRFPNRPMRGSARRRFFPAISTGSYGYPLQRATAIAVREAREALARGNVERVVFACFSAQVLKAYRAEEVSE